MFGPPWLVRYGVIPRLGRSSNGPSEGHEMQAPMKPAIR
jgi:hypothetical protein